MNFASAFLDSVGAVCKAANAILSVVPALIWALLFAGAMLYATFMHHERDHAVSQKNVVQGMYEQLTGKLIRQKLDAAELFKKLTAERDALQLKIDHDHDAQEKQNALNKKTIADQAARLAALAAASPGGQLRDPNAAGCGRGRAGAEGDAAADGRGSEEHATTTGGLVSAPLSGLLREQAAGADQWARLYGLARADALMCRAAMQGAP